MWEIITKIFGALGLILITWGIFAKNEKKQDWIFAGGGLFLLTYSIYLKDPIFIPLQIVFVGASLYEIYTLRKNKPTPPLTSPPIRTGSCQRRRIPSKGGKH